MSMFVAGVGVGFLIFGLLSVALEWWSRPNVREVSSFRYLRRVQTCRICGISGRVGDAPCPSAQCPHRGDR